MITITDTIFCPSSSLDILRKRLLIYQTDINDCQIPIYGWFGSKMIDYPQIWGNAIYDRTIWLRNTPKYGKTLFLTVQIGLRVPLNMEKCCFWPYKTVLDYPQIWKIPVFDRNRGQNPTPKYVKISFMTELGALFLVPYEQKSSLLRLPNRFCWL